MRIAIFSDNFYPELSGISDSIISLAQELTKKDHRITFYVPRYSASQSKERVPELALGEKVNIVRFFSFPYPTGTGQGRIVIPTGLRWLTVRKFDPDIIHSQLFFGVGLEALIAAKALAKPLVGTNHTVIQEYLRYSPLRLPWLNTQITRYVNWYYSKCELTTAPSQLILNQMQQLGFKTTMAFVSNPIDTNLFRTFPAMIKSRLKTKLGLSDFTLVYAGRFAPEKKLEVVLEAISYLKKEIPSLNFALAGHGVFEENLRARAKKLRIEKNSKFMGTFSWKDLNELYNASDVFVTASTSEVQPLTVLQAMAAGLPAIGVKAGGLPDIINTHTGLLSNPDDPRMFAEKIYLLFKNKRLRQKLGRGARSFGIELSTPRIAEQWETLYQKVVKDYRHHQ